MICIEAAEEDVSHSLVNRHKSCGGWSSALVTLTLVLLQSACGCSFPQSTSSSPRDSREVQRRFKVTAAFGAGQSALSSWEASTSADGKLVQSYWDLEQNKTVSKSRVLGEEDLGHLRMVIGRSRFFDLHDEYKTDVEDQVTLVLGIDLDDKSRRVVVYAPDSLRHNKDVDDFKQVWKEFIRVAGDPNRDFIKSLEN